MKNVSLNVFGLLFLCRSVQSAVLCNARDQRRFLHEMLNGRVLADVLTASIVESC